MFRAPVRESGLGAFIQIYWDCSQASVAHLPHPVIAYSWGAALNLIASPVISYKNNIQLETKEVRKPKNVTARQRRFAAVATAGKRPAKFAVAHKAGQ